eukprot:CAMPEP_0172182660 /NCGR_PEP_ID=MMETSP1050-20130122/18523_1 /TAXON_ID=233186 /ORGANISM="Cryptomonas curvata, Strain CCAP979/52" /LENGTH=34 /DNA_ID= /DNA_START= /DNA_END= /DNA_ORIENTATION=
MPVRLHSLNPRHGGGAVSGPGKMARSCSILRLGN